jgi:hypothetical protein
MSGAAELVLPGVVKWVPLSVRTVWTFIGDGGEQATQEISGGPPRDFLMQFDEGELRRPVDGDDEMELALSGSDLGEVDMEIADRIGLELTLGRSLAFDLRQPGDPMALKAAMQRRARQVRNCRLKRVEAVVERQQRMPPEGDHDRRHRHVWTPLADQGLFLALRGSWVRSCLRPFARAIGSAGPDVVR